MIIKGLIDQSYKILHRKRLHLENVADNPAENLDKDQPFINSQQTLLTKSQGSFSNPVSESPLILNNQKELDNVRAKILTLKSFFMDLDFFFNKKHTQLLRRKIQGSMILMGRFSFLTEHLTHAVL